VAWSGSIRHGATAEVKVFFAQPLRTSDRRCGTFHNNPRAGQKNPIWLMPFESAESAAAAARSLGELITRPQILQLRTSHSLRSLLATIPQLRDRDGV
jgi:hypothetical protein